MEAFITRRGGGGDGLNFTVVGGTAQPENPRENTIWVNIDREITGWSFNADEPDQPFEGLVWFKIGNASNAAMSAASAGELFVYPMEARQYVSGAWMSVDALSYLNGEWTQWVIFLLKGVDRCEEITNGWTTQRINLDSSNSYTANMIVTNNTNRINLKTDALGNSAYRTMKQIDLKGYDNLVIDLNVLKNDSGLFRFSLLTAIGSHSYANSALNYSFGMETGRRNVKINISNINSKCYAVFFVYSYQAGGISADIYSMHLE